MSCTVLAWDLLVLQVLAYWEDLRKRLAPDVKRQYWKLDFCAAACALSYGNLEAADR